MADNGITYTRDNVGYPYIRLVVSNMSQTNRTSSSVTLAFDFYVDYNGYALNTNYGGFLTGKINNTQVVSFTYLNPNQAVSSSTGQYKRIYAQRHSFTVSGISSNATTLTMNINSTSNNSSWTSFIWSCSFTIGVNKYDAGVTDTSPSGSVNATYDPTWGDEQCVRVNHQTKYALTVGGSYMDRVTVGGADMTKVTVGGTKVWFKARNVTNQITGVGWGRNGNVSNNSPGGCSTIAHCATAFNSNRSNPIRPKQVRITCTVHSYYTHSWVCNTKFRLFGLNSNGEWVELRCSNNNIAIPANSSSVSDVTLTVTVDTKNFFTNFKFGLFPDAFFTTTIYTDNIKFTSYDVDSSVE